MKVHRRSIRSRLRHRSRRWAAHSFAAFVATAVALPLAGTTVPAHAVAEDDVLRVLLFYKDNFHASHVQARQAVNELAAQLALDHGQTLEVQETQDPAAFTAANLATKDTVVFAQTGGVLFNTEQRTALEDYIRGGGGFMGLHYTGWSVGQSEHDVNPFYLKLVGAMSEGHPENPGVRSGRVVVNDTAHPLAAGLPAEITRNDEWYDWTVNPAPNVRHLVSADESSYNSLGRQGTNHPVTWCQKIDAGLVLVHRDGPRGHGVQRAVHARADAQRPRLRVRPAPRRLLAAEEGGERVVERRHAVAADADQHGAHLGRPRAVVRQRLERLHGQLPVRLDRQRLHHAGRPDRDRRVGPGPGADARELPRRAAGEHDLHRPVLLDAGAEPAPQDDHDGRR